MCFAPRYSSGTIARPFSPCRNTASLPETPCASSPADVAHAMTMASSMAADRRLPTADCPLPTAGLLARVSSMTVVARDIEIASSVDDAVLVLRLGCLHRGLPLVDHVARHLHPVARVDGA